MELVSLLILVLVVVAAFVASKFTHSGNPYPFTQKKSLFTQIETAFLNLLEKAIGSDYKIVSRVKLIDILEFQPGTDEKSRRSALAKAQNKQLDYVLTTDCDQMNAFMKSLKEPLSISRSYAHLFRNLSAEV